MELNEILAIAMQAKGSDVHLKAGVPPIVRIDGKLRSIPNAERLTADSVRGMAFSIMNERQKRIFDESYEVDLSYGVPGLGRFRVNAFAQRGTVALVLRAIPIAIPSLEALNLPPVLTKLAQEQRGLILVTGTTGSGKSTTLASMIDFINENRTCNIITIEDPVEYLHKDKKSLISQREVGFDTLSFGKALTSSLRQDPDVILVGEMRDLETISAAITAAETGHLVLATLHTTGGPETVDRIIDVFPPHQQQQIRMQLSATLEGVLSQVLLQSADGVSRTMAMEIMLGVPAISNLIREGKTHQMPTIIYGSQSIGMQTLDQDIKRLLQAGLVTFDEAISKAKEPRELAAMVGRPIRD